MSDEIRLEGLGVAPGVLDTIVTLAAEGVEGVFAVGSPGIAGLVQRGARKGAARAVDVCVEEDGSLLVTVHVQAVYGRKLREMATQAQAAISDALSSQVGVDVAGVDIYVDGLVFPE
ncbi:MAG: Asp23/Gls24 family envelope stress response protein [Actinobacteria bacterium HGW-Actinobacteria-7]|jgi:uncharacterized alkaline shock family protein YloU|nr:MAG: Asp23/Gls24 family envelope stress response protein [Actinobacteria bacterium HGW-Actinobacteria-7]